MSLEHFEQVEDPYHEWVVLGPDGAVTFLVYPEEKTKTCETSCCIGIHGHKPVPQVQRGRCDVLPEGHCFEQLKQQGAHQLWVLSGHGREEAMIWEVLEGWYNTTFGSRSGTGTKGTTTEG